ncbi:MAG: hypothetical protein E7436_03895 [Ruminococcaceae bacterium]|nr:hypothetical protein [Oscillospiraceae bacterium]
MKRKGYWIWQTAQNIPEKQSVLFRRAFLYSGTGSVTVDISASSRYKLYVNGTYICSGPQKGDRFRQYYDTPEVTSCLRPGENEIVVHVQAYPNDYYSGLTFGNGPVSVVGASRGGLWMSSEALDLHTDCRWECRTDAGYRFREAEESKYAGCMEFRDGRDGEQQEVWQQAVELCPADTHRLGGVLYEWQLYPRTLPMLFEKEVRPVGISRQWGMDMSALLTADAVQIPPYTQAYVDLDMGELVNAYVRLPLQTAGGGARVTLEYSESYRTRGADGQIRKEIRDAAGELLCGETDGYICGSGRQYYEPFAMRVFRFLRIRVETEDAGLTLHLPRIRLTGYPLKEEGTFRAEKAEWNQMWAISARTLRRSMLDTYVDCPYYEQMQYIMDTMIEALLTFQISADDRLARRAIEDFHSSRRPDGMIQCNAPANFCQIIPVFALYYGDLLYYHYLYYGDKALLKKYLPTMIGILGYFLDRIDPVTGLLHGTGYWSFVDWVELWRPNHGSPVKDPDEPLFIYSHILAYALERTAYLLEQIGWDPIAEDYKRCRAGLLRNLNAQTKRTDGYYRICADETVPCQHSQLWAVLSGAATGEEAKMLMRRCMTDPQILRCSYSMSFYLFRAMEKAGVYNEITGKWQPWFHMMDLHLTTWMEDTVSQRSDCHGWSAIPIYDLIAVVLGVRPAKPGYEEVLIAPHCPEMGTMEATVATCRGPIHIRRTVAAGGRVSLNISLPEVIPVHIETSESKRISFCQKQIAFDYISS